MAGIEGSESDAVKVETHLVLETSTSTGATETRDMSQDEQLSINDSTKAIPCKEEGDLIFSEGRTTEFSLNTSQHNTNINMQQNDMKEVSISPDEEIIQKNEAINNLVLEVGPSKMTCKDELESLSVDHIDTEMKLHEDVKPADGNEIDVVHHSTAVLEEIMPQVNNLKDSVSSASVASSEVEFAPLVASEDMHSDESSDIPEKTEKGIDHIGIDEKTEEATPDNGPQTDIIDSGIAASEKTVSENNYNVPVFETESAPQQLTEEIPTSDVLDIAEKADDNIDAQKKVQNETDFEDAKRISIPDPSIIESDSVTETSPSSCSEQTESMMEGAWADILGSGQLKKKTLKHGTPNTRPVTSAICTINMSGQLSNGNTVDVHENFKFQLGDLEVIQGIDLIVALMDVGEVSQIEIGPRFAYGSMGNGKDIPKESTLLYTVELLAVEKEKDLEDYSLEERIIVGNLKRERGNYWYSRCDYPSSIQCYRRALEYLDTENETETDSPDKLQEVLDDRLKVYNNMAAAQMKIEAYDAALKSVEHVLRCQKDNVKAIYRKAKIVTELGKVTEAISLLERALHLDPSSKIIQQDLMRLQAKQKSDVAKERSLYKKMFQLNDPPTPAASKDQSKIKLAVPWTLMIGAVTAFVASYVTYRYKLF